MPAYTPVYRCKLIRERSVATEPKLTSTDKARQVVSNLLCDSPSEQFVAILLDVKHRVIGVHPVTQGTLDASLVHPREVFRAAILANAHAVILSHNHPSGDVTPSREDIAVTNQLVKAGQVLGISVLDHLIVGDEVSSLRESGRWPE